MLIYLVTNKTNYKQYVGQTVYDLNLRKRKHIWDSLNRCLGYFHKAIRKHGIDNFDWRILHDDITTIEELNKLEIYYIGLYDTYNNGYNLTIGGNGSVGYKFSEETKRKLSELNRGKKHTIETKRKMSVARIGGKRSKETRERMSVAQKGKNSQCARVVVINNKQFDTRKQAAEFIGVAPSTIRYRILHKTKWLDYSYTK